MNRYGAILDQIGLEESSGLAELPAPLRSGGSPRPTERERDVRYLPPPSICRWFARRRTALAENQDEAVLRVWLTLKYVCVCCCLMGLGSLVP